MEVNIERLQRLMYIHVKKKKPFFVHGAPGIGKSDSVKQVSERIAKEQNQKVVETPNPKKDEFGLMDIRASRLEPTDLTGIPVPVDGKTHWLIPDWLPQCGEGIILLDELNLAQPAVQKACYELILDRKVGQYRLPDGWMIIAAGNRSIDQAQIFPMGAPLKNRFSHAHLKITVMGNLKEKEGWIHWALKNNIRGDIIAYLLFKPSDLFKFDPKSKDDAWASPRTWAVFSHVSEGLDNSTEEGLEDEFQLCATAVGEGVAHAYRAVIELKNKVDLDDLLKHPEKILDFNGDKDMGVRLTLIIGLGDKYTSTSKEQDRKDMLERILQVITHMTRGEDAVFLLRLLKIKNANQFKDDLSKSKQWNTIFEKYHKYLM